MWSSQRSNPSANRRDSIGPYSTVPHRVADAAPSTAAREAGEELVVDLLVDDRDAERGAPLTGGAETAEQRALDGEVEVGVGQDDQGVLAAELERRRDEVLAAQRRDGAPDRRRSR